MHPCHQLFLVLVFQLICLNLYRKRILFKKFDFEKADFQKYEALIFNEAMIAWRIKSKLHPKEKHVLKRKGRASRDSLSGG